MRIMIMRAVIVAVGVLAEASAPRELCCARFCTIPCGGSLLAVDGTGSCGLAAGFGLAGNVNLRGRCLKISLGIAEIFL